MNRHERRRAETQTRHDFESYARAYRSVFKSADDRAVGEGYMRGAKVAADGYDAMVLHPPQEAPPPASACELRISLTYGALKFAARARRSDLGLLEQCWHAFVEAVRKQPQHPLTADDRSDARSFILTTLVNNRHYESGSIAALIAGAIVWLAKTSPMGPLIDAGGYSNYHYEVSDEGPAVVPGSGAKNFRLMLS